MNKNKLFLLDAFALIYRAYYAFINNPIRNSKGVNTSATYGFTLFLTDLLKKENPTHLAVVFDTPEETERKQEYELYKANREAMPEDIAQSIEPIKQIIEAYNIPILQLAGYEADDIIGTIAKQKEKENHCTFMVTPDKDFAQLVSENIFIYKPSRKGNGVEILGVPEVLEKWNIKTPLQVIDILGMSGDKVDNIPGIPGVGEKTAQKLLAQYDSLENILEHSHELKGKLKENIENNKEQALMSKMLATIITDVPISVSDKDLEISEPDKQKLNDLFVQLEFRNLGKRLLGSGFSVNQKTNNPQLDLFSNTTESVEENEIEKGQNISNTKHTYTIVDSIETLKKLVDKWQHQNEIAFDTETTGLNVLNDRILGISLSIEKNKAFYIPISEKTKSSFLTILKPLFENASITKIGQNIKYDLHILKNENITLLGRFNDTMIAHYLLEPDLRHNLDYLSESYLGYTPIAIELLIGKKGKNQKSFSDIPLDKQCEYAAEDADLTWQLNTTFIPEIKKQDLTKVYQDIEMPLINVLANMERNGVKIDDSFLKNYSKELSEEQLIVRDHIYDMAGIEFNIDSPKQLGEVLFDKMKIPYQGAKTKTGQYATGEDKLLKYSKDNPIVHEILNYREITKLKSTYVDALPKLINAKTNRVHTTFSQAVASTGRLSSNNPNLQNIPIRTERGKKIRKAFIASNNDYILLAADYSQIELRLMAHMSNDKTMIEAFNNGEDIHTSTAAKIFNVPAAQVTREMRGNAKTVNFGIIYGVSPYGLSQQSNLSLKESKEVIDSYFHTYPGIKEYMDNTIAFARDNGYVSTLMGRRRMLRNINSRNNNLRGQAERNAINAPIQGSAADMIKIAMNGIHKELLNKKLSSLMTLQVHDELIFDTLKSELDEIKNIVKNKMQNAIPNLKVPIVVDIGAGKNWLEAH